MERVLVAGIGNVFMGDDAIGPFCIRRLQALYTFPVNVQVADLGAPGLDLILHVSDSDVVVFVDALRSVSPGVVRTFSRMEILSPGCDVRMDTHAPALQEAIAIAGLSGRAPRDVRLVGLGGQSFALGATLSLSVRGAMVTFGDAVLTELADLGVPARLRLEPAEPDIWWERSALA